MKQFPYIADCTVVGAPVDKGLSRPIGLIRLRPGVDLNDSELMKKFNKALVQKGLQPLTDLIQSDLSEFPLGPTGKVLKRDLREKFVTHFNGGLGAA